MEMKKIVSGFQYLFMIRQNEKRLNNFYLDRSTISSCGVKPVLSFYGGKYDVIGFDSIDFSNSILDFNNCSVKENLWIQRCKFNQPIGSSNFSFPKDNTSFNWAQIDSVGLGIYEGYNKIPIQLFIRFTCFGCVYFQRTTKFLSKVFYNV